jgi:hypothetical protein
MLRPPGITRRSGCYEGVEKEIEMGEQVEVRHTGGIGWFFFALIPGAIAGALLMYFAFYVGIVDWQKAQRVEGRMDNRVGVHGELTAPVDLVLSGKGCVKIQRGFLDDGALTLYIHNGCTDEREFVKYRVSELTPDGTVVKTDGGWLELDSGFSSIDAGATMEIHPKLSGDTRVVKITASTDSGQSE